MNTCRTLGLDPCLRKDVWASFWALICLGLLRGDGGPKSMVPTLSVPMS